MESTTKTFEFQIDKKPSGYVIRLNDEHGCLFRICKVPTHLVEDENGLLGFIDIEYPKEEWKKVPPVKTDNGEEVRDWRDDAIQ